MPREARALEDGAIYHVICRGNNKLKIFHTTYDCKKYMFNLVKYKYRYKYKLYAYILMPNHVHLLIEPKKSDHLPRIMNSLNVSYAVWHNNHYGCTGHIWQGRYKSRVIGDNDDFLGCMAYIEINPVTAGLVEYPDFYKWSSYFERSHTKIKDKIIDYHNAYEELGDNLEERRLNYNQILFRDVAQARTFVLKQRPQRVFALQGKGERV